MKNRIIAVILTLTLICSSAFLIVSADNVNIGDVNNDGKVNASDARLTLRAAASLEKFTEEQKIAADINFDNKVNASDARIILRIASKLDPMPEIPTQESTTVEKPTAKPTEKPDENKTEAVKVDYPEAIDAFFSGKYYLEALVGEGADASVMKMAISDKGFALSSELEVFEGKGKIELSIMQLAKILYIKYPDADGKKKYLAFDEKTINSLKESLGIDISELFDVNIFEELNLSFSPSSKTPEHTKGKYKGEDCDIYKFDVEDGKIAFYTIGEDVKTINIIDADGNEGTAMEVIKLTKRIPGQMLSTSGHTKAEVLEFFTDLMALMGEDIPV